MDWLTPTIFIQILLTLIMGLIGLQIRSMAVIIGGQLVRIEKDLRAVNEHFLNHVSDYTIHVRG